MQLLQHPQFQKICFEPKAIEQLSLTLDMMRGVARYVL